MTWQIPWLLVGLTLQAMSWPSNRAVSSENCVNGGDEERTVLVTLVTGELLRGRRTHELPWSTPLIHSSWKVAWAATVATRVTTTASFLNIFKTKDACDFHES